MHYKLNFQKYIKHLEEKLSRLVRILSKLKYYLSEHASFNFIIRLVHFCLIYGLIVLGNTYPTYLSKVITLQNKDLRVVQKVDGIKMLCLFIKSITG